MLMCSVVYTYVCPTQVDQNKATFYYIAQAVLFN